MTQRRLKVGDIVDDYCPRERRITDHAVVAMIDDAIRQTRCTACDNEHPYKEARTPRARRKNTPAALYSEVLANVTEEPVRPISARADAPAPEAPTPEQAEATTAAAAETPADEPEEAPAQPPADEGPVHRPLIRATLPRPEGAPPAQQRNIPEFTVRQSNMRGRFRDEFRGGFRGAQGAQGRNGNQHGQGRPGRPSRPGGSPNPHARPRRGRPSPHKKRSR
jgi:hypothetical protein